QFLAQFLDRRFGDLIRTAVQADATLGDRSQRVRFTVNRRMPAPEPPRQPAAAAPGAASEANATGAAAPASPRPRVRARKRADAVPMRQLDDMVVAAPNELAYTAACRLADPGAEPEFSLLFIHGACGVGKTHLLQGLARRFQERSP